MAEQIKPKARIIDIALQAGVSTATVDRVLNGRIGVRQKTVDRVHEAIRALERAYRDAGVEPIYAVSPMVHALPRILALDEEGELPNLLAFHLPKSFALLFAPEKRIDLTHKMTLSQAPDRRVTRHLSNSIKVEG